jgi:putative spermidine/putrescine transport system substrate-binding protein
MKRRDFIISAGAVAAGAALAPRMAFAAPGTIDWFTSSDQNVLDFWTNVVKPKFEAANPGVTLNLVDGQDNAGLQAIAERALAALGTKADPQVDIFEGFDSRQPVGAREKGLYGSMSPGCRTTPRSIRSPSSSMACRKTCPIAAARCCWPTTPPSSRPPTPPRPGTT